MYKKPCLLGFSETRTHFHAFMWFLFIQSDKSAVNHAREIIILFFWRPSSTVSLISTYTHLHTHTHTVTQLLPQRAGAGVIHNTTATRAFPMRGFPKTHFIRWTETFLFLCSDVHIGTAERFSHVEILMETLMEVLF